MQYSGTVRGQSPKDWESQLLFEGIESIDLSMITGRKTRHGTMTDDEIDSGAFGSIVNDDICCEYI